MNARWLFRFTLFLLPVLLVWQPYGLSGQAPSLTIVSRDARRPLPLTTIGAQELVAVDDLAAAFGLAAREESGALTLSYRGRTIVLTQDQTLASVAGRVISLPSPPVRVNGRWLVPLDVISRALAGIYDTRLELRRQSRLVIVGELRVPRVTVRHEPSAGGARVSFETLPRTNATVTREQNHVTVRFEADALDLVLPDGPVPGIVQGYRPLDPTAIAVELGPQAGAFRNSVQVADAASTVILDILPQESTLRPDTTQADATPAPAAPAELPALFSSSGFRAVVIDAGHGGDDRGAVGARGTLEKDVTLAMARRLKAVIEARLGIRVLMTREDDHLVAVSDRPAVANNNKADLFISLHANASWQPAASGATIYVASFPENTPGGQGAPVERLPAYGGGMRDIELVPWNLAQVRHRDQSELFASLLLESLYNKVPLTASPIERAPLRALESANMPAILLEAGFLSNPAQERLLTGAEFQTTVAQAIVDAITRYRGGATSEDRP